MLANHRDAQSAAAYTASQISSSGFHCHVDDLVVVAPFLPELPYSSSISISSSPVIYSEPHSLPVYFFLLHSEGRGPPAVSRA